MTSPNIRKRAVTMVQLCAVIGLCGLVSDIRQRLPTTSYKRSSHQGLTTSNFNFLFSSFTSLSVIQRLHALTRASIEVQQ